MKWKKYGEKGFVSKVRRKRKNYKPGKGTRFAKLNEKENDPEFCGVYKKGKNRARCHCGENSLMGFADFFGQKKKRRQKPLN